MKAFAIAAILSTTAAIAGVWHTASLATPTISEARLRTLSAWCEVGEEEACRLLRVEAGEQRYNDSVMRVSAMR